MAFSLSEFRSQINAYGGLAGTNKYLFTITNPPWYTSFKSQYPVSVEPVELNSISTEALPNIAEPRSLSFFSDSINLPGKSLETASNYRYGYGKQSRYPIGISLDPLTTTFMLDSNHRIAHFFQYWMQQIINTDSLSNGSNATHNSKVIYEMGYRSDYETDAELAFFSDNGTQKMVYSFQGLYPVQIGNISIGWDQNDTIAKLPVEFAYSNYTVFKESLDYEVYNSKANQVNSDLTYLGYEAGLINTNTVPNSLQETIDTLSII